MAKISKKDKILEKYAELNLLLSRRPTMDDLVSAGFTKDSVKHHFSSLANLEAAARDKYPDNFFDIEIEDVLNKRALNQLRSKIKKHKRFVVTTAVTGCPINDDFYASIKNYCALNKALLLILVASDPSNHKDKDSYGSVDQKLTQECIVFEDTELNSNLFLSTIKLSAKHIDPITGLDRIGQRDGSFIFASPKQRLHMVATSNIKLPHALMTTGAITKPNYKSDTYMSERTSYIANHDHVMGGIIVEIKDEKEYHYRQIQMSQDGSFVDLGVRYYGDKSVQDNPEGLVLGDWHAGETDQLVAVCTFEMMGALQPKYVILHDAFNGLAINHHEEGQQISNAIRHAAGQLSLEKEIFILREDIKSFIAAGSEVIMVKSNHDEFLSKHYLQKGKYTEDPQNHRYALPLAMAMLDGKDPLRAAVEAGLTLNDALKIKWLQRDDDFKIGGIQLGAHGDKGPNGSRGSLRSMEKAYDNSITGHSHVPGILRGAWSVGTSSYLKLNYNLGPSSWLQAHCLVYSDGSRQLINIIDGKWKL